ncbi:MAG: prenyltransferase/squalene oxidase repeat-containing protein [Actinoallomurus sp.]
MSGRYAQADPPVTAVPVTGAEIAAEAAALVAGLVDEPWGQVSASVYETGRLVALSPGLTGHDRRVDHLLRTQRPDGGWGSPEPGYALVPTLSATDALLSTLRAGALGAEDVAATVGLRTLFRWLRGPGALTRSDLPDLPAIELIVPSLVASINRRLDELPDPPQGAGWWPGTERLHSPAGIDGTPLELIRGRLAAGHRVPQKLLHALEVAGDAAQGHPLIRPETTGTVGASPAATAAWLGDPAGAGSPARRFLEDAVRRHDGPVPCGLPVTVFERAWVLGWLARSGVPVSPPAELAESLAASLGATGTAAAAGLPQDADTTAGALYALALAGRPQPPDPLWAFEADEPAGHFCTWPGEEGVSVSTNAHVLEAFGQYLRTAGTGGTREAARRMKTVARVAGWLRDRQREDGSWHDRWHASPYYATSCAALALRSFGGRESAAAVDRAVRWVLDTQRPDGSWGHWAGTAEETAYAVQILLPAGRGRDDGGLEDELRRSAVRGCDHLIRSPRGVDGPALWHDKDLYQPTAIVHAAILAALHLGHRDGLLSRREGV